MTQSATPSARRSGLSKSRIAAFEQCPKRLWLQVHRPELAEIDASKELRFAAGHEVGEVACSLIPGGIMIEAEPDLEAAITRTAELMKAPEKTPLFEATFAHDGVLVRLDIMEPQDDGSWHVAEVKSATSRKDCYIPDLATQLWVLHENGVPVSSAAIRHIDNSFVLTIEGDYAGLFKDAPSLEETADLVRQRASIVAAARDVLVGSEPERGMGDHCNAPYSCEFGGYCKTRTPQPTWPISLLPNSGRKLAAKWAEAGIVELTEVPTDGLSNPIHLRIRTATVEGSIYHDHDGAMRATADWGWPRSYLDFETIAFAVPRWIGTKPWQQVPFQFSLQVEAVGGSVEHREFLSLDGSDPRQAGAEALIEAIPSDGAIIAYNASFERTCIKLLAQAVPHLQKDLEQVAERIVDLLPVTRNHWYHRDQRGSWSIKAVLPTLPTSDRYDHLVVADGSAAQAAYLAAIHPECEPAKRAKIDADLRAYCALDTRAMIMLLHHLTQRQANS